MPNMAHEQSPRFHRRQRRLLAARRAHDQDPRPGGLRGHAPGRPAGGRDARLHHAAMSLPGVTHRRARQALPRLHPRPQGDPRPARLPRLSRSRSAPRSTTSSATASRRDKRLQTGDIVNIDVTVDPRRLVRRHQPHVLRRRRRREGAPAVRRHLRGDDARHRRRQAGRPRRRHRPRHPDLRRGAALLGRARLLRATASAASSTTRPTSCTTARPAPGRC